MGRRNQRSASVGGQRRTIKLPCGKVFQGSAKDVKNQVRRHGKVCRHEDCGPGKHLGMSDKIDPALLNNMDFSGGTPAKKFRNETIYQVVRDGEDVREVTMPIKVDDIHKAKASWMEEKCDNCGKTEEDYDSDDFDGPALSNYAGAIGCPLWCPDCIYDDNRQMEEDIEKKEEEDLEEARQMLLALGGDLRRSGWSHLA